MKNDIANQVAGSTTSVNQSVQNTVTDTKKETPVDVNKKTVLLVEDDPILSRMYSEKFKFEGYNVIHAQDGLEGYEMIQKEKVNIVLLDIMLPKLSGTDLLEKIRALPNFKDMPVVVLTNLAEKGEMDKAKALGAKEYLIKAMQTPEAVITTLKKYMS